MCMRITSHPRSAHSPPSAGSRRRAVTSLTISAPASSAVSATATFDVSIEIGFPSDPRPASTGATRASSSSAVTARAPGRVDSPPTSSRSVPSSISCRACAIARSGSRNKPPSENESGVTLTMPISRATRRSIAARVLLRPDQLARRIELHEVVRLAGTESLALVGRLVIDRLTRVVGDVRDPVGKATKLLGDAGPGAQVDPACLGVTEYLHRLANGAVLVARLGAVAAATSAADNGAGDKQGK